MIEAERRFCKERNKEIVEELMKNTPKEALDSLEFKVSLTFVYNIFTVQNQSIYLIFVKLSIWADLTAICPVRNQKQ